MKRIFHSDAGKQTQGGISRLPSFDFSCISQTFMGILILDLGA